MGRTSTRIHHSPADKRRSNDSDTASPYDRAIRYRLKQRSRYATDNTVDTSCSVARRSLERKKIDPTFNIVVRARSYLGPRRSLYVCVCVCKCARAIERSREPEESRSARNFTLWPAAAGRLFLFRLSRNPPLSDVTFHENMTGLVRY